MAQAGCQWRWHALAATQRRPVTAGWPDGGQFALDHQCEIVTALSHSHSYCALAAGTTLPFSGWHWRSAVRQTGSESLGPRPLDGQGQDRDSHGDCVGPQAGL